MGTTQRESKMKTNHRRINKTKGGFDYSYLIFQKRWKLGLSMDHDGGHRGHAKDVKELKTHERRKERRKLNRLVTEYMGD